MYFEVTDLTVGELEKCFDQKDLGIDVIRTAFLGSAIIKKIRTITDAMNRSTIYKGMLPEVDKLSAFKARFPKILESPLNGAVNIIR